jgi:peptidyl-tRNA hydrolase, PTH1 family
MWLLVGLGNPGPKYAQNRHNVGFMVIDELARRWNVESFKLKFGGEVAMGEVAGEKAALLKPMEYMNLSGRAVQRTAAFYQVEPATMVVVHDEIDLEMGRLKLKTGGGHAGHNGIRSIAQDLGSPAFARVRCGVGRPGGGGGGRGGGKVADFVLGDFGKADLEEAKIMIQEAADAVELIVKKGMLLAMNKWNTNPGDGE